MNENIEEKVTPEIEHEPIDGKSELSISSDLTEATLTVYSSHFGGKNVTEQEVLSERFLRVEPVALDDVP